MGFVVSRCGAASDCGIPDRDARFHVNHPTTKPASIRLASAAPMAGRRAPVLDGIWVEILPVSVSRFRRLRSALSSAADWQRTSRSFSSALLITSSSLAGTPGFKRTGATGGRFRIPSNITPDVSPRNGNIPVHIS